ncbi:MAG TPA: amidase [Chloroflexota bacterium]|nr:amidase [Chloroflexota bacterium]
MSAPHELEEISIAELQRRMTAGELSAQRLVEHYVERIEAIDRGGPTLRSVLEINPDAIGIAEQLDGERAAGRLRGPLHGIPILLKDNIDTADQMQTTAGSLALVAAGVEQDATVARRLREAGAVLLGKANLSEWANFRSTRSSSGWSGRGRQTRNPYVLDRSPGGSSSGSGVAVAANLCAAALGTETDGSIMSPSSNNGVVGIKPTVGLTSRAGVIPISHSQDTVGPHARSVADAATVLSAIAGGADARDSATTAAPAAQDYTTFLDLDGLRGARIGVSRKFHTGYNEHTDRVLEQALDVLRGCGAEVIENVEIPGEAELRKPLQGADEVNAEGIILQYEFNADLAAYLASRPGAQVKTVADVIRFNQEHADVEMPYFRQERLEACEARGPLTDELYQRALQKAREFADGFGALFSEQRFDTLVAPTNAPAWAIDLFNGDRVSGGSAGPAAVAGFPLLTVPAGFVCDHLPIGLTFMGAAWSESTLIRLAFAFEQANPVRRPPAFEPTTLHLP